MSENLPQDHVSNDIDEPKPIRTRKSHPKVRTGCLSCKIRRKKCDEQRPFCRRCVNARRSCDGYLDKGPERSSSSTRQGPRLVALPSRATTTLELKSPNKHIVVCESEANIVTNDRGDNFILLPLLKSPGLSLFSTDRDFFCFNYFRLKTAPEFSGYYDSNYWKGFIIRTCLSDPTVRQAAVALGAVHRRHELGITPEAFEYCDFAAKSYTKALRYLQGTLEDGSSDTVEIGMITSMLFAAFEAFQGNYETASSHLASGLKIVFSRTPKKKYSESKIRSEVTTESTMRQFIIRLEKLALDFFREPPLLTSDPAEHDHLPEMPSHFTDAAHAHNALYTQVQWLIHSLDTGDRDEHGLLAHQQDHIDRFLQWSSTYAEYSKTIRSNGPPVQERPLRFLRIYLEAAYLLVLTQIALEPGGSVTTTRGSKRLAAHLTCVPFDRRCGAMDAHFSKLLMLADSLLESPTFLTGVTAVKMHAFSVKNGIVPSLDLVGPACQLQESKPLFSKQYELADAWDPLGTYGRVAKLAAIEEDALLASGVIPKHLNAKWLDVTWFLEERKISMRYCTVEEATGGSIWTQEWVTF